MRFLYLILVFMVSAACTRTPDSVTFLVPSDFRGRIVLKEDKEAGIAWVEKQGDLELAITAPLTRVRDLKRIAGKLVRYGIRLPNGRGLELLPESEFVGPDVIGFYGGWSTSEGEIHFFLGKPSDAIAYHDLLVGR